MAPEVLQGGNFIHDNVRPNQTAPIWERFSLKGKTANVTGAASGIGFAVLEAYAQMGANVAIWYNTNKLAPQRAAEIEKKYGVKCM